jgi:hypothetical protein
MPKEKKYKIWLGVILGVGTFLLIGMGVAWAMLLMKPQNEELASKETELSQLKSTAQGLAAAKQALADAQVMETQLNEQLAFFRTRYRAFDYGNWDPNSADKRNKALQEKIWRAQMKEFSYVYGPRLIGELIGAASASGVQLTGWDKLKIAVQDPPKGPEDLTIPPNGLFKPTGEEPLPLTIVGNLDQILTFFKKIHQGQILMKVGSSLKLTGSSPRITATFTVQPYLVAKGKNVNLSGAAPAAPAAGGSTPPSEGAPAGGSGSSSG